MPHVNSLKLFSKKKHMPNAATYQHLVQNTHYKLTKRNCDDFVWNPTSGWARCDADNASTFANHLKNVFLYHMSLSFYMRKSPGCDLIFPKMIIELPYCAVCKRKTWLLSSEMEKVNYNNDIKAGKRPHNPHVV